MPGGSHIRSTIMLDTQFEYNSRLLNLGKKKDTTPTKDRIEKMTEQEAKELLLKLLGTK